MRYSMFMRPPKGLQIFAQPRVYAQAAVKKASVASTKTASIIWIT
jgi:hypothetical protein